MPKKRDGVMTFRILSDDKKIIQAIADKADASLSDVVLRAVRDFTGKHAVYAKKGGNKKVAR